MGTIILIGGAPTSGKSTIAQGISRRLGIPWVSTDQLRDVMRAVVRREDFPLLFNPTNDPEEFLTRYSAEEIAAMEFRQGESVWPAVRAFISEDYTWRDGFVVEGVNILPSLVRRDFSEVPHIRPVFVIDENENRIRHVIRTRGLWADADTYPDALKEKEVEWVGRFNRTLREEAARYGYPLVSVEKTDADADRVLDALGIVAK